MSFPLPIHGRGALDNPRNRFETIDVVPDPDAELAPDDELPAPRTVFLKDTSRKILTTNDSPDVGMETTINPYRGCEHGCIYCFARPTHEYLGFSAGLDFETKIMVKHDAPQLLRAALSARTYQPGTISISGVTDCYQPVERTLRITRGCLEVLAEFRNPVGLITKNHLITRDADVLSDLATDNAAVAILSVTTLDADLQRVLEPRTSSPARRLDAIAKLKDAGVPVGVMVAPIIPGLTDHETPAILKAAADAGASFAAYVPLRLPYVLAPMFEGWLERHFPDRKDKVLNRIRSMRGGKLNDGNFHTRMVGQGVFAEQIATMFEMGRRKAGLSEAGPSLSTAAFRRPPGPQLSLWE
jgi:DNA repair photolyase